MDKIDRLGWAAGIVFRSYGLRIGIRVSDPAGLESLADRLPPGWRPASTPVVEHLYSLLSGGPVRSASVRRFHVLYAGALRIARSLQINEVFDALESDLRSYVAEMAPRRLFVHAGVVGWRGKAILIPGRSHSGKSRLVEALVRAGAAYASDEYAVFDRRGRVHPFPAPLMLRGDGEPRKKYAVDQLGGHVVEGGLPVGLVVVSRYRPGARWRPRRLTEGQGLLALLDNTIPARRRPRDALAILGRVVSRARVLKGPRGEAAEAARFILEQVNLAQVG